MVISTLQFKENIRCRLISQQWRCNRDFTEEESTEMADALVVSEHPRLTAERLLFKFGMYDRNGVPPVKTPVIAFAIDMSV